jgi:hypothetical protein
MYYKWERDFPKAKQAASQKGETIFRLDFALDAEERAAFRDQVGSVLTGTLPIELVLGDGPFRVRVIKPGPGGGKALSAKSIQIAQFLSQRLDFEYIPAVRTAESAQEVLKKMVQRELATVERDSDYQNAVAAIAKLQQPVLDQLAGSIRDTLIQFLPAIQNVKLEIQDDQRDNALRSAFKIVIDDGTPTELEYKGDGVQSLAALGIMRHASERGARGKNLIVAIEEPESHLHPRAIHELRSVITELASKHQLLISTHCPLFVNRRTVAANVIVSQNRARQAKSVEEIREILGVRASDNLRHAELVLLVEGSDDQRSLRALLAHFSNRLRKYLSNGVLAVDTLAGGTNLAYKVSLVREALCEAHAFLDHDSAGLRAFEHAKREGLLDEASITFATAVGMPESELEDLFDPRLYASMVQNKYRVSLSSAKFRSKKKWTLRMKETFSQQGQRWTAQTEMDLKNKIADLVQASPAEALLDARRSSFDALVHALETRLPH